MNLATALQNFVDLSPYCIKLECPSSHSTLKVGSSLAYKCEFKVEGTDGE
jgi:hypothetical protein